ncbi:GGDEF domain-containing protein [Desulfovibrio sp. JC022]|nr:GGDEF domain-containing protein [Desulfovibrio sp. JC022]
MNDFAQHDNTLDYLVLMQVQESIHNDTQRLADKLLEETKARRKTQEILEQTNLSLEDKVQERTKELSKANNRLEHFVERLRASNNDLRILNETGEELHRCQTISEALPTVVRAVQTLFPDSFGRISCFDEELGYFKISAEWGGQNHRLGKTFTHEDCPAIVGKTSFSGHGPHMESGCPELENMGDEYYFCRPLRFGEKTLGLIHFHYGMETSYEDQEEWLQSKQTLAATLAEHIALALSNIRLRQRLEEKSIRDPLTRLFNRRYMEHVLEQELAKAKRDASDTFGIILLDVDHFKIFNDTHGHQAGDQALIQLSAMLSTQVRKSDVVCRYGGEEFLLILAKSSSENTVKRAENIRVAANKLCIEYEGKSLGPITVSAGVTGFSKDDQKFENIIRRADDALYKAKEQGRNKVIRNYPDEQ